MIHRRARTAENIPS